ncbi:hypothetical protein [Rhizobium sp. P007]|uniref:hypothetical protein n=1 Tax=Rhizobium sp. P007 TaxID=285908 RepID=UPI001157ADED|nr:hypothetical protein [Rhizobium sp. P007]CAD7059023.1 hypothetical protein RP007_03010 [Rhizobium sp. P007]
MRMKINQKMAGGASALDRLYEIAKGVDRFDGDAYDVVTSAEIMQTSIEQLFEGSEASRVLKDGSFPDYHLIPSTDRRYLAYQIDDTTVRARALEKLANDLSGQLFELYREMKGLNETPDAPEPSGLDTAISEWQAAYDAWATADKGNHGQIDTPESLRERQALIALAQYPCSSLEEVRRKADLFQTDKYLNGNAPDLAPNLLRSFAEAGGA